MPSFCLMGLFGFTPETQQAQQITGFRKQTQLADSVCSPNILFPRPAVWKTAPLLSYRPLANYTLQQAKGKNLYTSITAGSLA